MEFCMNKCFPYVSLSLLSFGNSFTFKTTLYLVKYYIFLWVNYFIHIKGDIWASQVALVWRLACQCRRHNQCRFNPWIRKIPWKRACLPTPVFLPGNPTDRGAWRAIVHSVSKTWTWLKQLSMNTHKKHLLSCFFVRRLVPDTEKDMIFFLFLRSWQQLGIKLIYHK